MPSIFIWTLASYSLTVLSLLVPIYGQTSPVYVPPHLPKPEALRIGNPLQFQTALPTVTVRGFLNFRTTVDGTVIVFTPASAAVTESSAISAKTATYQPPVIESTSRPFIRPTATVETITVTPTLSPSLNSNFANNAQQNSQYPTGLVTVLGGTVVLNGATTVYETKVIGTYIEGKYAQVLQSTSRVSAAPAPSYPPPPPSPYPISSRPVISSRTLAPVIEPSRPFPSFFPPLVSSRVLPQIEVKAAVADTEKRDHILSKPKVAAFDGANNALQPSFKPRELASSTTVSSRRIRPFERQVRPKHEEKPKEPEPRPVIRRPLRPGQATRRVAWTPRQSPRVRLNRFKVKVPTLREKEEEEAAKQINQRLHRRLGTVNRPTTTTTEKPVTEAKVEEREPFASEAKVEEEESRPIYNPPLLEGQIEPHRVVTEVQTITSEVTQHVDGNHIKVETVTLTTTVERTLHPSEFQSAGVRASIPVEANDLDATAVQETPPIVISRTYSVTERSMRTMIVPVFDGSTTAHHTVTESFFIRKLITAYKTIPPGDLLLLETASMEMNNSSFVDHLQARGQGQVDNSLEPQLHHGNILMTSASDQSLLGLQATAPFNVNPFGLQSLEASLNNFNQPQIQPQFNPNGGQSQFDLNNPLVLGAALQNPALAAMYLGLQQLNQQQQTQYTTITRPTQYLTTETVFNTKVVSFYDGRQTRSRTITEPASTIERVVSTYTTEVTPVLNPQLIMQQAQLQRMFATQLLNQGNPFQGQFPGSGQKMTTISSPVTSLSTATSTNTKIYTLVYNAFSTKYRTVTSTSLYPTTVTTYTTTTIPVGNILAQSFPYFG